MASLADELSCSICLDIYKNPVMLNCGHNFCQECIEHLLNVHNGSRGYTCPECRATFEQRPVLRRNLKLWNVIQYLQEDSQKKPPHSCLGLSKKLEAIEKRIESLTEQKTKIQEASDVLEKTTKTYFKMIERDIKTFRKTVLGEISRKKGRALLRVSKSIHELEMRKRELARMINGTIELNHMADPIPEDNVETVLDENPIGLIFRRCLTSLIPILSSVTQSIHGPKTLDVLLDVRTACNYIQVSPDYKSASYVNVDQHYPEGPQRFQVCQVLSTCCISAQQYWEVDVSEAKEWIVGVAYPRIGRKTLEEGAYIGFNKKSWCLEYRHCLSALHIRAREEVTLKSPIARLGVYVDYDSGVLSFYQLSDQIRHLYSFTTTFTESLHATFHIFPGTCITIPKGDPQAKAGVLRRGLQVGGRP